MWSCRCQTLVKRMRLESDQRLLSGTQFFMSSFLSTASAVASRTSRATTGAAKHGIKDGEHKKDASDCTRSRRICHEPV